MKTYLAITIGPIYQTFLSARSTREVWGASYFFSYLAKSIILKLIDKDMNPDFEKEIMPLANKFILPNIDSADLFDSKSPVGLFPDNIIVEADILGERDFSSIRQQVVKDLAKEIGKAIKEPPEKVQAYLETYLKIIDKTLTVESPILDVTPVLNLAELQPYYAPNVPDNYLSKFLKTINNKANGFMKERGIERFESLVEISTVQLAGKGKYAMIRKDTLWNDSEDIDSDGEFINRLVIDQKDDFKTYHKYIAVVKVDGDKIGATLKTIKDEGTVRKFSKKLLLWGLEVKKALKEWKAKAIYIGGDDLLFFAPMVNPDSQNIFDLIKAIDDLFANQKWEEISEEIRPTLSYGLSVTYYKYPLIEALDTADQLLYQAKEKGGNLVAVRFLKHSGSELPFVLEKNDPCFEKLFKHTHADSKETRSLLSGIVHKIRESEPVFGIAGHDKSIIGSNEKRVRSYFQNVFEETEDDTKPKNGYLKALRELMVREYGKTSDVKEANTQVFAITRTIKFLKGLDELKD